MWTSGESMVIRTRGVSLEGRGYGPTPERAPTIVLLHEGLGCIELWRDFPQKLAEATGYGVFAYSRQGYGRSDAALLPRPLDYMTREAVDVLPDVLKAIGFKKGVLAGHSDGASIAAIYAGSVQDHRVRMREDPQGSTSLLCSVSSVNDPPRILLAEIFLPET